MSKQCLLLNLLIGAVLIPPSLACNGYSLKVNSIKPCAPNPVVKWSSTDITLDNNCNVVVHGCLDISKPVKIAKGTYSIKKPPLPPMEGKVDCCEILDRVMKNEPQVKTLAKFYHLPTETCPVPKFKVCSTPGKDVINIDRFKNHLGIAAGTATVNINVTHDTGVTCYDIIATVSKAKNRG